MDTFTNPQFTKGEPLHGKGVAYKDKKITNNNYGGFHNTDDNRKGSTDKYPTSIIKIQKPHPSKAVHRTEKPVELLEYLIKTYTNEGDLILDNCMGSGSTGVACVNTNRNFIGIELNEHYSVEDIALSWSKMCDKSWQDRYQDRYFDCYDYLIDVVKHYKEWLSK